MGRPSKSLHEKIRSGTLNHRDLSKLEDPNAGFVGGVDAFNEPPEGLSEVGREEWYRIVNSLKESGRLLKIDYGLLNLACIMYETAARMYAKCLNSGFTQTVYFSDGRVRGEQPSAHYQIFVDAYEKYRSAAMQFGVTPAGRYKISIPNTQEKDDDIAITI